MLYKKNILEILYSVTLFIIIIFFLLFKNSAYEHWSHILDQDITIIYNAVLLGSNIEQEYLDHPAYSTMFILNVFFKISYFLNISEVNTLTDLLKSNDKNKALQILFNISQTVHIFYSFLILFLMNKILNIFINDKTISFLLLLIILFSPAFIFLFDIIRSEILSLIFCFLYFLFLEKSLSSGLKNIFYAGIFFALALLAKIQVVLCLYSFLIIFFLKNFKNKSFYKDDLNFQLFTIVLLNISFLIFMIYYVDHFFFKRVDKLIFIFLFLNHCLFFIFFEVQKKTNIKYFTFPIIYFFSGFFLVIFILTCFKIFGLVSFHYANISIISSPISTLAQITTSHGIGRKDNIEFVLEIINFFKGSFKSNLLLNPLSLLTYILSLPLLLFNIYKKNYFNLFILISLILIITIMNLIMGIRPYHFYKIYSFPFNLILLTFIIKEISYQKFFTALILAFYLYANYSNIEASLKQKRLSNNNNMNYICKKENINNKHTYMRYYHQRLDEDFFYDMCNSYFK